MKRLVGLGFVLILAITIICPVVSVEAAQPKRVYPIPAMPDVWAVSAESGEHVILTNTPGTILEIEILFQEPVNGWLVVQDYGSTIPNNVHPPDKTAISYFVFREEGVPNHTQYFKRMLFKSPATARGVQLMRFDGANWIPLTTYQGISNTIETAYLAYVDAFGPLAVTVGTRGRPIPNLGELALESNDER
jgi:hypothetical protein